MIAESSSASASPARECDEREGLPLAPRAVDLAKQVERGQDTVLIVDEAQDLTDELLEQVRLLSNLETDNRKLLQIVLSNCAVDAVNVYPTYRKPFDLIFRRAKTGEWCARGDSNTRPSGS